MQESLRGNANNVKGDLATRGIRYGISIGRRAPMHRVHVDCLREIKEAGLEPVMFIGSANNADSPLFDPIRNPLTLEQQKEQLRRAVPDLYDDSRILSMPDLGHPEKWFDQFFTMIQRGDFAGKSVVHYRSKTSDTLQEDSKIRALSSYAKGFAERGMGAWESFNIHPDDDKMNATDLRKLDLEHLSPSQRALFAAPDYITAIAKNARESNPDKALLEQAGIPITMLDLSLERLHREAALSTAGIINEAKKSGAVTADTLSAAAITMLKHKMKSAQPMTTEAPFQMKIASASCNQTGGDWPRNIKNICRAIDMAVGDGADMLCLEELGLSGYERGDDFYYSDNMKTREMLQLIADYAASKDPNLIISVGHPWYFADKSLPSQLERLQNPLYNIENQNFNVQSFISGGEIVAMSAKSYLFNYERGYEKRHFSQFSQRAANEYRNEYGQGRDGAFSIALPEIDLGNGVSMPKKVIPFGDPVVQVGDSSKRANLYHVICHGKWVGSRFEGQAEDNSDYERDNPLAVKSNDFAITVAINPNASPPAANKIDKHYELDTLASRHCDVFVDTDGLGSSGSTFAQFGGRLMAQKGQIVSEGVRNSFKDVAYTSQIVSVTPPVDKGHAPHVVIAHQFKDKYAAPVQDGPAQWEKGPRREFEEEMRNELLWLFDYMRKNKLQGISQALSGGADSSYNATKVGLMVQLACHERGVEGFFDAMSHLKCKPEAMRILKEKGEETAISFISDQMLTSVYMGTDNSSLDTLRAAFTLVVGGSTDKQSDVYKQIDAQLQTLIDGTQSDKQVAANVRQLLADKKDDASVYAGIGGEFHYRNVQRLVEIYAEIFSGVNPGKTEDARELEIRKEITAILQTRADDTTREELERRVEVVKATFEEVSHDVLSTAREEHQLAYENIQARLRQVLIMLFSNVENKIAIANPNLDEGRNSYATWGGDLHGGMISGNAHKNKQRQLDHMALLEDHGLEGIKPVKALHWANKNRPSAELQPKSKDGKVTQFDEDQLGRSFEQMDVISHYMLYDRPSVQNERKNNPTEVLQKCCKHKAFEGDSIEMLHDRIRLSYDKWAHAQFKVHGSPIASTYGKNIDHQSSLRTPNTSAFHKPELAQMALHCLDEMARRDGSNIEELTGGYSLRELSTRALVDDEFGMALTSKMWTPAATDGRKLKVGTLYDHMKEKGFDSLLKANPMADILQKAGDWRKRASARDPDSTKTASLQ
jgi:NH3-dependent NAD+ synthetase